MEEMLLLSGNEFKILFYVIMTKIKSYDGSFYFEDSVKVIEKTKVSQATFYRSVGKLIEKGYATNYGYGYHLTRKSLKLSELLFAEGDDKNDKVPGGLS